MDKATATQADIDKEPEIHDVDDLRFELHLGLQVFQPDNPATENGPQVLVPRILCGSLQRFENIPHQQFAHFEFRRQLDSR